MRSQHGNSIFLCNKKVPVEEPFGKISTILMELFGIRIRPEWPFHMTIVCFVSEQFLLWLVWRDQLPLLESFSQNPGKQRPKSLPVFFYSWIRYDPDPAILGRQLKVRITLQLYRIFKILLWSLENDYRKKLWWLNFFKKTWEDKKNNWQKK